MNREKTMQLRGFIDRYQAELDGFEAELSRIPSGLPGSLHAQARAKVEERAEHRRRWIAEFEARLIA
jgi:hypothetical protein